MKSAIDDMAETLERMVKRYREKRVVEPRRQAPPPVPESTLPDVTD
jgi:ribosome-associated translation inhibitor RaiA